MEYKNFHPVRTYASVFAALTTSAMLLTWTKLEQAGFGWTAEKTNNGYHGWGFLSLVGAIGVFVAVFMGDKLKPFDQNGKIVAMASFGLIILGAIITIAQGGTDNATGISTKIGFGVYIAIFDGIAGLLAVSGLIKIPEKKGIATNSSMPPQPPPPPPNPPGT